MVIVSNSEDNVHENESEQEQNPETGTRNILQVRDKCGCACFWNLLRNFSGLNTDLVRTTGGLWGLVIM